MKYFSGTLYLYLFIFLIFVKCSVFHSIAEFMKNEPTLLIDSTRPYKFIPNIQYEFSQKSGSKYNYKPSKSLKNSNNTPDNLRHISKKILSNTQTPDPTHHLKTQQVAIKGNILTIDTFYQRIIVNNKEILTIDTVVISNVKLFNSILAWLGTKYKYGGTSQKSIDCSALMRALVHTTYNVQIPRTAMEQHKTYTPIPKYDLQEGDLIFFAIHRRKRVSHVGMFLSNEYFIHAGTSSGVTLSSLKTPYWNSRIIGYGQYRSYKPSKQK